MLESDPATRDAMAALDGNYRVSARHRHSYESSGPRYSRYRLPRTSAAMRRIVHATAEVEPWCKTGGLADVVGSLPNVEARLTPPGSRVLVLCPLHRGVRAAVARRGRPW